MTKQVLNSHFNSTLVRLLVCWLHYVLSNRKEFQFHIGAIIRKAFQCRITITLPFQFHIGAIIRIAEMVFYNTPLTFQFHIGAIISMLM